MTTFSFFRHNPLILKSQSRISSLGLGVIDEVSVSSRNFNQVSVLFSKVTVSETSLTISLITTFEEFHVTYSKA